MKTWIVACSLALSTLSAEAQVAARKPFVHAIGQGVISVKPDQLRLTVSVVTLGDTASSAADANATLTSTVISKLKELLGANPDLQTVSYSVTPNYKYPTGGGQPTITGFTASNSIQATSADLTIGGRLIDAAVTAGATNVQGLQFGLKDNTSAVVQALRLATLNARAHADAIANGLGLRVGAIQVASEGSTTIPSPVAVDRLAAAAPTTPIETGTVQVTATVTIEAELAQ